MAAQQPARTSPELRARLHSVRANVGITPRPGALPLLAAQASKGKAVIMVTHDLDLARYFSRQITLSDGAIIQWEAAA